MSGETSEAPVLVNGKEYPMWNSLVEQKEKFIGGIMVEHDICGEFKTVIKDIRLEPNGEESAMIWVDGEEWSMSCDVKCGGIGAHNGALSISASFGGTWELHERKAEG